MGVTVRTNERVEQLDAQGVVIGGLRLPARTVVWAAGVSASPVGRWLGCPVDSVGRVCVESDLTVAGRPEIFVLGDTALLMQDGRPLPGVAPVAIQQGDFVARAIRRRLAGQPIGTFRYLDKGNLATIGRTYAVADIRGFKLSGLFAWMTWVVVHIYYLIGFRNRLLVLTEWAWAYLTWQRGARLITHPPSLTDREAPGP